MTATLCLLLLQWPLGDSVSHLRCELAAVIKQLPPLAQHPCPTPPGQDHQRRQDKWGHITGASLGKCQRGDRGLCALPEHESQDGALVGPVPWVPRISHSLIHLAMTPWSCLPHLFPPQIPSKFPGWTPGAQARAGLSGCGRGREPQAGGPDSGKWERSSDTLRAAREGGRGV